MEKVNLQSLRWLDLILLSHMLRNYFAFISVSLILIRYVHNRLFLNVHRRDEVSKNHGFDQRWLIGISTVGKTFDSQPALSERPLIPASAL